jgi:hypothetical protein
MWAGATELDQRARLLIRATEDDLRVHLGVKRLSLDLIGELYVRIHGALLRADRTGSPGSRSGLVDELALTMYLAVAADPLGTRAVPELLTALRRTLAGALERSTYPDLPRARTGER